MHVRVGLVFGDVEGGHVLPPAGGDLFADADRKLVVERGVGPLVAGAERFGVGANGGVQILQHRGFVLRAALRQPERRVGAHPLQLRIDRLVALRGLGRQLGQIAVTPLPVLQRRAVQLNLAQRRA